MIYREWLVMRKAILVYLAIAVGLEILVSLMGHVKTNFVQCMTGGAWFGALFASVFGVALGNSSREGARVFWVLPKARWQSALGIVAVDLIATMFVTTAIPLLIGAVDSAIAGLPGNAMQWNWDGNAAILAFGLPIGVYGWAALVGMIGRRLPYVGIAVMPVLLLWFIFATSPGTVGQLLAKVVAANPFALYIVAQSGKASAHDFKNFADTLAWLTPESGLIAMVLIALTGCVAAITMWSKTEVLA